MDIFKIHEKVVGEYVRSYLHVRDEKAKQVIDEKLIEERNLWPEALIQPAPAKPQAKAKASTTPETQLPSIAKPLEQLTLVQVDLIDPSIASEGTFSQRLKWLQKLTNDPSPAEIAELTVLLAAPEASLRWLASSTLPRIGGPQVEASVRVLVEENFSENALRKLTR